VLGINFCGPSSVGDRGIVKGRGKGEAIAYEIPTTSSFSPFLFSFFLSSRWTVEDGKDMAAFYGFFFFFGLVCEANKISILLRIIRCV